MASILPMGVFILYGYPIRSAMVTPQPSSALFIILFTSCQMETSRRSDDPVFASRLVWQEV